MNHRIYMVVFAAALLAGCNRDVVYDGTSDPVTVFEYTPAPGQFIGELPAFNGVDTQQKACEFAEKRLANGLFVSLGGFGGYIVVGFGTSIANKGGYDFSVSGNQMASSSEPGVVWVMRDENGNGLPDDDAWYELAGSETGKTGTVQGYSVTYLRPEEENAGVEWTDDRGGSGTVARVSFHTQPSYYPAWITSSSYTLTGTLLESRSTFDGASGEWINAPYDWGYADNWGGDRDSGTNGGRKTYFKISGAVDANGDAKHLPSIDFIKVQTAVNANAGALGEISTEVTKFAVENITH